MKMMKLQDQWQMLWLKELFEDDKIATFMVKGVVA
jgi:hypothetical protein